MSRRGLKIFQPTDVGTPPDVPNNACGHGFLPTQADKSVSLPPIFALALHGFNNTTVLLLILFLLIIIIIIIIIIIMASS